MTNPTVFARMPIEDVELLKEVSKARGEDLSDFVRRAVYKELASLSFLPEAQKKALGMKQICSQMSKQIKTQSERSKLCLRKC